MFNIFNIAELQYSNCHDILWDYCLENDLIMIDDDPVPEWILWRASRSSSHLTTWWSGSGGRRTRGSVSGCFSSWKTRYGNGSYV